MEDMCTFDGWLILYTTILPLVVSLDVCVPYFSHQIFPVVSVIAPELWFDSMCKQHLHKSKQGHGTLYNQHSFTENG